MSKLFFIFFILFNFEMARSQTKSDPAGPTCAELKRKTEASFLKYAQCKTNSDCSMEWIGCPFGCKYFPLNKKNKISDMPELTEYFNQCGTCEYKCAAMTMPEVACVKSKCTAVKPKKKKPFDSDNLSGRTVPPSKG